MAGNTIKDNILYGSGDKKEKDCSKRYIHRLFDLLRNELSTTGDREWLYDCQDDTYLRIKDIEPSARKVAQVLRRHGFQPGDVLQTGSCNNRDFYWPVFGTWLAGGIISLGDPSISDDLIRQQLDNAKAKFVAVQSNYLNKYLQIRASTIIKFKIIVIGGNKEDLKRYADQDLLHLDDILATEEITEEEFDLGEFSPNDDAIIFWSSGSTGTPKGIVHPHKNLETENPTHRINKALISTIMFHLGGFLTPLIIGMIHGGVVCFFQQFDIEQCLDQIVSFRPQIMYLGAGYFIQMTAHQAKGRDFSSLFMVMPVGGCISPGVMEKMKTLLGEKVGIVEGYGSTEVMSVSVTWPHVTKKLGLLGTLTAESSLYIQDVETGEKLGPGKQGKIMVKNSNLMSRFLNNEGATDDFFDKDGYGFTGDIGYYTEDGEIFFTRRMKDAIKVDNNWFGPGEIESFLESQPDIQEVQVWGEYDTNTASDKVHMGIMFARETHEWTPEKIRELVATELPPTRRITGEIYFLDSLPHNLQDKKLRRTMKDWVKQKH